MNRVIVDTGPLVALLETDDRRHEWTRHVLAGMPGPLFTCEPVIVEAAYLMRRRRGGPASVLEMLAKGVLALAFRMEAELETLRALVMRYASVPMSLADACLVRMAERLPGSAILTFDSDFNVYRLGGRHSIPVIMPGIGLRG